MEDDEEFIERVIKAQSMVTNTDTLIYQGRVEGLSLALDHLDQFIGNYSQTHLERLQDTLQVLADFRATIKARRDMDKAMFDRLRELQKLQERREER